MPSTCKLKEVSVTEFTQHVIRRRRLGEQRFGVPQVYAIDAGGAIMFSPRPKKGMIKSIHIVISEELSLEARAALPETED